MPLSSSDADEKILAKAKKAYEEDEVTKGKVEKKYKGRGGFGGGRWPYEYGGSLAGVAKIVWAARSAGFAKLVRTVKFTEAVKSDFIWIEINESLKDDVKLA